MKKIFLSIAIFVTVIFLLAGCSFEETKSTDESGNEKKIFEINETATVNDTKIEINSVKKILKECDWEYDGKCQSYTEPDNDYFILIDLTIENTGEEGLNISSIMSFELKDSSGEKGEYALMYNSISSQLDGEIMANDLLKGQIAYDVKASDVYYFYYSDSLLDSNIKFIINSSDIE